MRTYLRLAAIAIALAGVTMPAGAQNSLAGNWKITAVGVPCAVNLVITGRAAGAFTGQAAWACRDGQQVNENFVITTFPDHFEFVGKMISVNKGSWLAETFEVKLAADGRLQGTATDGQTSTTVTLTRQ
ncbi:MAG TPA: hypothetical protein VGR70_15700 [Stellaceae bacterium]|nr:hypothetical protein [Stellaceae bacterium]